MTWHEDREITPGVPDLSYVMLPNESIWQYETGWLELKAVETKPGRLRSTARPRREDYERTEVQFKIEPSQVSWIGRHHQLCPVDFLCAVDDLWFLVSGRMVEWLASGPISLYELYSNSVYIAPDVRELALSWALRANTRIKRVRS